MKRRRFLKTAGAGSAMLATPPAVPFIPGEVSAAPAAPGRRPKIAFLGTVEVEMDLHRGAVPANVTDDVHKLTRGEELKYILHLVDQVWALIDGDDVLPVVKDAAKFLVVFVCCTHQMALESFTFLDEVEEVIAHLIGILSRGVFCGLMDAFSAYLRPANMVPNLVEFVAYLKQLWVANDLTH